jgi:hypothetical protein
VSALVGLGQGLGLIIAADGIVTAGQGALLALSRPEIPSPFLRAVEERRVAERVDGSAL